MVSRSDEGETDGHVAGGADEARDLCRGEGTSVRLEGKDERKKRRERTFITGT